MTAFPRMNKAFLPLARPLVWPAERDRRTTATGRRGHLDATARAAGHHGHRTTDGPRTTDSHMLEKEGRLKRGRGAASHLPKIAQTEPRNVLIDGPMFQDNGGWQWWRVKRNGQTAALRNPFFSYCLCARSKAEIAPIRHFASQHFLLPSLSLSAALSKVSINAAGRSSRSDRPTDRPTATAAIWRVR